MSDRSIAFAIPTTPSQSKLESSKRSLSRAGLRIVGSSQPVVMSEPIARERRAEAKWKEAIMRSTFVTLVTLSAIAGAAGAATWNPNQGAAVPGDGVYIGKVTKHVSNHGGDRVTTYFVTNESGALEIKPGELSPGQLAALEAAWGQNDNDNFAKVADGRVTDVGTGGPFPSQAH